MKKIYPLIVVAIVLISAKNSFSQDWVNTMQDPNANFYDAQKEFSKYWDEKEKATGFNPNKQSLNNPPAQKGVAPSSVVLPDKSATAGWKQFKRWEAFMEPRVYPTGDRLQMQNAIQQYHNDLNNSGNKLTGGNPPTPMAGNWTIIGPTTTIPAGGGAGRVNCIRFQPGSTTIVYAGTPAGGLWKSTNGGTTWNVWNTDALAAIGVSDLAIDPSNVNVMYLASGDGDAGDTYSLGVLKSIDGGLTWNTTGLSWAVSQFRRIRKLLIDPGNTQIIHAATNIGMERSTDGGTTWAVAQAGDFFDAEFNPSTPATVYATTATQCFRSTNSGASYASVFTNGAANRLALAVTPANNAYVYMLAGSAANSGFLAFYRSTNSGASFTQITPVTPSNILGWATAGNDVGGQSWYDLTLAASPTNANECIAGGVNIWRTTNNGSNWTLNGHWTGSGAPYVHADQHDLIYTNGTTCYSGNDGGFFRTTNNGGSWTDLSNGLQIAQMYRLSTAATNVNMNLSGWQDNGTNRVSTGTWTRVIGGDGMECIIDYTSTNIQYGELYYGAVYRTANNWGSSAQIVGSGGAGVNANGNWVTPYIIHPTTNTTLLIGKAGLYRSTNSGTSWTALGATTGGSGNIVSIAYAPSNPNYIYAAKTNAMFVSTNGGTSFTNITGTLPVGSAQITYIAVSGSDPNDVWVTFSGYSAANKVFQSTNAGGAWTNISTGLPNLPANTIVYQNGSADAIYVGTDVGVWYRDNASGGWVSYSTGLPNVVVDELEIQYSAGKVRAATFGRGMWESDLFSAGSLPPVANFISNFQSGCMGQCFNFTDQSTLNPTSWSWSFPGGVPATSTAQNPANICYAAAGTYSVTLTATNANGSDSEVKTSYITISPAPGALPLVEGFQSLPFLSANWIMYDANTDANIWQRSTTVGGYSASTACSYFDNYNIDVGGARDAMWTPKYNLSAVSTCTLTFDVAYARYNATYSDSMACLVSTDCGQTWTQVWMQGGTTLATAPDVTATAFVPTAAQWKTETVNLNAYAGQATFMVAFQNRGRWGQMLYVDNINIAGSGGGPPVAAFTASATTICVGSCINYTDNSTGAPTSWSWTFGGGTPATSTAQNPASICYSAPGTYTTTLTATNGFGSSSASQTITVSANPTASAAGPDQNVCATTATLAGNAPTVGTGLWTLISGSGTITTPTSPTSGITALGVGTNTFRWTISNAPCTASSDDVDIVRTAAPTTANAGPDQTVCASTATLAGNAPVVGTGLWTLIAGSGTITTPTSPTSGLTALGLGTNTFRWTISNPPCAASFDDVNIVRTASPSTANAGPDQTVCATTATLAGNAPAVGTGLWTLISGSGTITTPTSPTSGLTGLGVGTNTFRWTISNAPCTASSDDVNIVRSAAPTTSNAGPNQNICGTTATLAGNAPTVGTGLWTLISGSGTITTPTSPTSGLTALGLGTNTFRWTISNPPCAASFDDVNIVTTAAPTTSNAGPDQNLCTSTATLAGNAPTVGTGLWTLISGSGTITTPTSPTSGLTGLGVGTNTFRWTISNAPCTASSDDVNIVRSAAPTTSNAGPDQSICATTATLAGNTPLVGTGMWTLISGSGTITTPTSPTSGLTALGVGANTFRWTISSGACAPSLDDVIITRSATPTASSAGPDQNLCGATTATLAGNTPVVGTGLWTLISGSGTITTPTSPTSGLTALGVGANTFRWTISNGVCTPSTDDVIITRNSTPTVSIASQTNVSCNGGSNGSATASITGGTSPYTYSWSTAPLQTNVTATGLSVGTYTVSVIDVNGCNNTTTVSITQPTALTSTVSTTSATCGNNDGNATVTASNGTSPYTYNWTTAPVQTTATATGLTAGIYTVTITDANGCTINATASVANSNGPTASIASQINVSCNGGNNGSATASALGGTAPYTYSWSTAPSQTTITATGLSAGNYSVTVSDANSCTSTSIVTVSEPAALSTTMSATNADCGNNNGTATASVSGGTPAFTYSWATSPVQTTVTATGLTAGTYSVMISDANNCAQSATVTVPSSSGPTASILTQTNVTCNGGSDGSATATATGGTVPYTYSWNTAPVQTTINATGLSAGNYTVIVSDVNSCTSTSVLTVSEPTAISATVSTTNATCGNNNGTASVSASGGTPGFTYSWTTAPIQTTATATGLAAGTYSVTISDANNCTQTSTVAVAASSGPTTSVASQINVSCNGGNNGSATASATGGTSPYTYSWSTAPTQTTITATGLSAANYSITVTDVNGCSNTTTVSITQPVAMTSTVTTTNATCGSSDGTATANVSGGTSPYTYNWSTTPAQSTSTATGLSGGNYTVTITDANGCTQSATVAISVSSGVSASILSQTNASCNGDNDGSATASVSGGTSPYTYSWSTAPTQTTITATGLSAGNYSVTVIDMNGCSNTITVSITEPTVITLTPSQTNVSCNGGSDGSGTASSTGGTSPYTYSWNTAPAQTTITATGLSAGTYTVIITDAGGCTSAANITITQPGAMTASMSATNAVCGSNNGSATVAAAGGTSPYIYVWTTAPVQTTATATGLSAGTYSVTITDANGCTATSSVAVNSSGTLITSIAAQTNVSCFGGSDGSATASGAIPPYTYSWNTTPAQNTQTATGLSAGQYTVTVTDASGCTGIAIVAITQPATITASATALSNASCSTCCDGTASSSASGGTTPYTYSWSTTPAQVTANATGLCASSIYTVCITDANGCSNCDTVIIPFTNPTGISSVNQNAVISIFPNPANDYLFIEGTVSSSEKMQVNIVDLLGQPMMRSYFDVNGKFSEKINTENLPAGVYFIEINSNDITKKLKFVIL